MLYKYIENIKSIVDDKLELSPNDLIEITDKTILNRTTRNYIAIEDPKAVEELLRRCVEVDSNGNEIEESHCINIQYSLEENKKEDKVNHPSHYTWLKDLCGIEVIDITRHMDFDLGNSIKYILRCGRKSEDGYSNKDKTIEDLKKAIFYINDKINMLENE